MSGQFPGGIRGVLANGSSALFRKSLDVLAEAADTKFEAQRELWESGRISDAAFELALGVFVAKAERLERMWKNWLGDSP
jgi:hypothetical protein